MDVERRTLLQAIGAAGVSLTATGYATADDGRAEYVVTATGAGARDRLTAAGFEVFRDTANSQVFGVRGPKMPNQRSNALAGSKRFRGT
ncbi:hypothetical protein [Halovenus sp. HT40]|uniref:hypothetical protein n=1 Tax=Halovenus sp. HT40 TaxID=3126691 RepID=UPI00300EB7C2